jgi:hypothetical protein
MWMCQNNVDLMAEWKIVLCLVGGHHPFPLKQISRVAMAESAETYIVFPPFFYPKERQKGVEQSTRVRNGHKWMTP